MSLIMDMRGELINPFDLNPKDIDERVMARTLSRICRFWGQTYEFYSVAQHCIVLASHFLESGEIENAKWALVHEVFESYTGADIPSPIKERFFGYAEAEERALKVIANKYNLPYPMPKEVKEADRRLMVTEAIRFMSSKKFDWTNLAEPLPVYVIGDVLDMKKAEAEYLKLFYKLFY